MGKYRYRYPTHEPEHYGEHEAPEATPWLEPGTMDAGNRLALIRDIALIWASHAAGGAIIAGLTYGLWLVLP